MAGNGALDARDRGAMLGRLASERFDVLVIGGGITGAGAALDAASSAVPAPVMPPPMTSTSNRSVASLLSIAPRSRASRAPLLAITHPPDLAVVPVLEYVHRQPTRQP